MTTRRPTRGIRLRASQLLELARADAVRALAESAEIDFVIVRDDDAVLGSDDRDAKASSFVAASIPALGGLGMFVSTDLTQAEPFNTARELATIDILSDGRAGLAIQPAGDTGKFSTAGIHYAAIDDPDAWLTEAIDVIRGLWTTWEPDAVARNWETNQFVDAARVHPIEFEGEYLSVRGPAATPRSPQGNLPMLADLSGLATDVATLPSWSARTDLVVLDHAHPLLASVADRALVSVAVGAELASIEAGCAGVVIDASGVTISRVSEASGTGVDELIDQCRVVGERVGAAQSGTVAAPTGAGATLRERLELSE